VVMADEEPDTEAEMVIAIVLTADGLANQVLIEGQDVSSAGRSRLRPRLAREQKWCSP
jgi:hypothetical protein